MYANQRHDGASRRSRKRLEKGAPAGYDASFSFLNGIHDPRHRFQHASRHSKGCIDGYQCFDVVGNARKLVWGSARTSLGQRWITTVGLLLRYAGGRMALYVKLYLFVG